MAALDLAYAWDHGWYAHDAVATPSGAVFEPGPLLWTRTLVVFVLAFLPLLFARDYARLPPGAQRRSVLVVAMGLPLNLVFQAAGGLVGLAAFGPVPGHAAYLAWSALLDAGFAVVLAVAVATAAYLLRHARAAAADARRGARRYAVLLASMPLLALGTLAGTAGDRAAYAAAVGLLVGLFFLAGDLLVVYALLRFQIFELDVKLQWTLRRGTLAAMFIAVFFVVTQVAQDALAGYGPLVGGVAAGLLLFALSPLQKLAERVASVALPGVKQPGEMSRDERHAFYLDHARVAWADGKLTGEERDLLDHAREKLGLSHEEAARLEQEARRSRA
jgi:hypothetical protein